MNLENIKQDIVEFIKPKNLSLYDLEYHKSDQTLSIILDNELSMDDIEKISNELSEFMDKYDDEFEGNYILDVCTVGIEKDIRNENELNKAIGQYIYVKTKTEEYYGDLIEFADGIIKLETKDKTRIKKVEVEYADCKKMRYAVKF